MLFKKAITINAYIARDTNYKRLSFIVGVVSAYALFSALHLDPDLKIKIEKPTEIIFDVNVKNTNTKLEHAPENASPVIKENNKTPLVQAPAKDPVPTVKPTQQSTKAPEEAPDKSDEKNAPKPVDLPKLDSQPTPGNTSNATAEQHIETPTPNEVIRTGGTFGSGAPEVIKGSPAPMLEIPRNLDATEISNNPEMRDKVEKAAGMSDRPPLPDPDAIDQSIYTDVPGGDVVILKLFINDRGVVIDSKIMIPSKYPLNDLTVALSSKGAQFKNLVPPLRIGEIRELEVRVPYIIDRPSEKKNALP